MDINRSADAIRSLVKLVARLRGPGGCPWDAEQTDDTIKIYLLEEAYEVLDALEGVSPREVCSELGDLLFQILFLAQLASERGEFDFNEVVEGITEKMTRRHPHVFGDTRVDGAEDVASNWVKIKRKETGRPKSTSFLLQSVPSDLPALLRAHRLSERAS
ncbi:MAG: MazG family protein, partial [Desulfobacteraceae bacterium]|nr:MazG family protein [Desulfobacteraceae bacterium]